MPPKLLNFASRSWAGFAVLALGVILSAAAALWTASQVERDVRFRFDSTVADARDAIDSRIRAYSDVLLGVRGLFIASSDVGRGEFREFVDSLELKQRYPGIEAVSYARRITAGQKPAFEAAMRKDTSVDARGYPDFAVRPAGDRPEYVVVQYLEPTEGREAALGLDLGGEPVRLAALEQVRDSGRITATGSITLALDPRNPMGFAMRLPLYQKGMPLTTVAQRRAAFTGVVATVFIVADLMRGALSQPLLQSIHLRIHDAGFVDGARGMQPAAEDLIFDSDHLLAARPAGQSAGAAADLASLSTLEVGGRRWNLKFRARPEFFAFSDRWLPLAVMLGGAIISLLLFGLMRSLASVGGRAIALAERITLDLRRSEANLAEAQRTTQELIEALPNPIFFKRIDGRYLGVNKAWERYFGVPREAFVGKTVQELYPDNPDVAQRLYEQDLVLWSNPGTQVYETSITTPDGQQHQAIYYKATLKNADGSTGGLVGTIVDVTERKRMEHALAESEERYRSVIAAMAEGVLVRDRDARIVTCNASAERILGRSLEQMRGSTFMDPGWEWIREDGTPIPADQRPVNSALRTGQMQSDQVIGLRKNDGSVIWLSINAQPLFVEGDTSPSGAVSTITDITQRKQAEERVHRLAHFDELTGLANRSMFNQRLSHALVQARRNGRPLAILFIDLDRFKNINDTLGHEAGDRVLKEVAQRLQACLRGGDTVGRLGGDEFVVLIEELPQPIHVAAVAQKILAAVVKPYIAGEHEFHLTASIGISTYPHDSEDMPGLLKNADIAMYRAKEQGRNNYQFYSAPMNIHTLERLALESDLRRALARDEFVLHYQPKVDIGSGRITGMEALVRWQRPGRGLVAPAQFIPLAEDTGLIVPIGAWVLKTACTWNQTLRKLGLPPLRVAVNLSARQFTHERLLQDVARVLADTGLDPAALELEITESMVMHDPERAARLLGELKDMGIHISIDDFGTGYSSLAYLKRFALDSLKIDRSFIRDMPRDADDAAITRAIIAMAHSLRLRVVAEGVEADEQLSFLRDLGCDEMQGYHFSEPLPEDAFLRLLQKRIASGGDCGPSGSQAGIA